MPNENHDKVTTKKVKFGIKMYSFAQLSIGTYPYKVISSGKWLVHLYLVPIHQNFPVI